jgi:hypothetical protein
VVPAASAAPAGGDRAGEVRLVTSDEVSDRDETSPNGRYRVIFDQRPSETRWWRLDVRTGDRVRLRSPGGQPDLTDDGRALVQATTGGDFRLVDPDTGAETPVPCGDFAGRCGWLAEVSGDGRYLVATTYEALDGSLDNIVYALDVATGVTKVVLQSKLGDGITTRGFSGFSDQGQLAIDSAPFGGAPPGPHQLFDFATGTTTPLVDDTGRNGSSLSADGRYFTWQADDPHVPADRNRTRDVYQLDRSTGEITWVSRPTRGGQPGRGTEFSNATAASPSGRFVAFGADPRSFDRTRSRVVQVILWDRRSGTTRIISRDRRGHLADAPAKPETADDRGTTTFLSRAENLLRPGHSDVKRAKRLFRWSR